MDKIAISHESKNIKVKQLVSMSMSVSVKKNKSRREGKQIFEILCESVRLENSNNKEDLETFQAKHIYWYENISKDKHHFKSATGLELEVFDHLLAFLNPGKNAENIKFYDV